MKKIILIILLILTASIIIEIGFLRLQSINRLEQITPKAIQIEPTNKSSNSSKEMKTTSAIFVPYWTIDQLNQSSQLNQYNRYIYFGVAPNSEGINRYDPGFLNLTKFNQVFSGKKTLLTLRMIDDEVNEMVLSNVNLQEKLINQSITLLQDNNFTGVVLDLEINDIFGGEITDQINEFVKTFYTRLKENYKTFTVALYGDTFFRKRPYDTKFIGEHSDGVMIMAYDFHKSRGEPGPNFPLDKGNQYPYDFKIMVADFSQVIAKEKITVIFGMFGYDWSVDEKKRPIRPAQALTLNEINKQFFNDSLEERSATDGATTAKCPWQECLIKRDKPSKETQISYVLSVLDQTRTDNFYNLDLHIIWFEDEQSVAAKKAYLEEQGIGSIGYWAYGYF